MAAGRLGHLRLGIGAIAILAGVGACNDSNTGGESATSSLQAVVQSPCAPGANCTLTYELPSGLATGQVTVVAHNQLSLSDRSGVTLDDGSPAPVANTGTSTTEIGASVTVASVAARGHVFVRSAAKVLGAVHGTSFDIQQSAQVGSTAGPVAAPAKVTLGFKFPVTSGGDKILQPSQQLPLAPGRYGSLTVNRAATLKLAPGTYYLDSLQIESGGFLQIDATQGTVVVLIRQHFVHRGTLSYLGAASDALFGFLGTEDVFLEGEFDATVIAPAASLTIGPANNLPVTYDGTYYGNNLLVRSAAKIHRKQLSLEGSAIAGVGVTYTGNPTATLPQPVPSPVGKTPKQYMDSVEEFIKTLRDSGYRGPALADIPAHPDYTGKEHVLDSSISSQVPNPPRAPAPGSTDALVATAKPAIVATHPETDEGFVTPPAPAPAFCPLGSGTSFPPSNPGGSNGTQLGKLDKTFGDPMPNPVPDFDGWFGGGVHGEYGFDQPRGLHAELNGDFNVGFSVFGFVEPIVGFNANAFAQSVKPAQGEQFGASATAKILGNTVADYNYAASLKPWHGDFCTSCKKNPLLPQDITIPVAGIVSVFFNAGLEAALPASFEPTPTGPLFTFAPMFRAFAIVGAQAGEGLRVRAEGHIDVVRIDAPVTVSEKFESDTSPSVCAATINPQVDLKLTLSTLNGEVYIKVQIFVGVGYADLLSWKLFTWDGFHYDLPIAHATFPGISVPLDSSSCLLDTQGCTTAAAQHLAPGLLTPSQPATTLQIPASSYFDTTRAECKGQYLLELENARLQGTTLRIQGLWDPAAPATDANGVNICDHQRARISVFGNDGTSWSRIDYRDLQGAATAGLAGCSAQVVDHGAGDGTVPGSQDTTAIFITPSKYPGGVRIAQLSAQTCNPVPLQIDVSEAF